MTLDSNWLLPDGFEEVLPGDAARLEDLRQTLLALLQSWGYELARTPLVEYLESLLSGVGQDLDLQTFKITDQLTGKLMGIRADMTPQIARLDAYHPENDGPERFCYEGSVLRSRPAEAGGPREVLQIGAELFGHAGTEADMEILDLMEKFLRVASISEVHLGVNHVGIYKGVCQEARFTTAQEQRFFKILQTKSDPDLANFLAQLDIPARLKSQIAGLPHMHGDWSVLDTAWRCFQDSSIITAAINNLARIAEYAGERFGKDRIYFDLSELSGYRYHTGMIFTAYAPGEGTAIVRGGRYDHISRGYGSNRSAVGFSADLRQLMRIMFTANGAPGGKGIAVKYPLADDDARSLAGELRAGGEVVVNWLPNVPESMVREKCNRIITRQGDRWVVSVL